MKRHPQGRRAGRRQEGWLMLGLAITMAGAILVATGALRWMRADAGLAEPGHVQTLLQHERLARTLAAYAAERLVATETDIARLQGLALWLDAADASTLSRDTDNRVSQWRDRRDTTVYLTAASTSNQPTYGLRTRNGRTVVGFDGSDDWLVSSTNVNLGSNVSIFAVAYLGRGHNTYSRLINGESDGWLYMGTDTDERVTTLYGTADWQDISANSTTSWREQWLSVASVNDGTDRQFVNGNATATRADPMGTFNRPISIGGAVNGAASAQMWQGDVAEVLIFSRAVSSREREMVEGYLAHKWGLTTPLPTAHAYKTPRPVACPVDPAASSAGWYARHDDDGLETRTDTGCAVQVGTLPWQTLGLQRRDAFDRFGQPLTYAITPSAGSAVSVTRPTFCGQATEQLDYATDGQRLVLSANGSGTAASTAPDVPLLALISHGQDRLGAYRAQRDRPPRPTEAAEYAAAQVRNYDEPDDTAALAPQLALAPVNLYRNASYFDDLVWSANASGLLGRIIGQSCP